MRIIHTLGKAGMLLHHPDQQALGGIANAALNIAAGQAKRDSRVSVLGFSYPQPPGKALWKGVEIQSLRRWNWAELTQRYDASMLLPLTWQILKCLPVDVLHVHELGLLYLPTNQIKLMHLHIPVSEKMGASHLWKQADGVICVSQFIRDSFLEKSNYPAERTFIVNNGAEQNRVSKRKVFVEREKLGITNQTIMVLFVGALTYEKGPHTLIEAVKYLRDNNPEIFSQLKIYFVGGSRLWRVKSTEEQADIYEKELIAKSKQINARFTGLLPHKEVPLLFKSCDIAIFPSIFPDPHPLVVCEALAAGKPIIASRVGGIPETIKEGKNGFLVPPEDPLALAQKIKFLIQNPILREKMGEASLQRSQFFTWDRAVNRLDEIYRILLERKLSRSKNIEKLL